MDIWYMDKYGYNPSSFFFFNFKSLETSGQVHKECTSLNIWRGSINSRARGSEDNRVKTPGLGFLPCM